MLSIYKKEIISYFNSFIGYLAIGLFLLIAGLLTWIFPETSILNNGYSTLESFFRLSPYLLLLLIPAISMQSIAGEKANGTFDLLLSKPITFSNIVLAKFLGSYTISLLAILLTLVYPICLYFLAAPIGNIDIGGIIGSYLGLFLLSASFTAISIFSSSLTDNPIIAFLLAVVLCFITYYGFDAISSFSYLYSYGDTISSLGIQYHYDALSRGVLTAQDFIYFISFTTLFLTLSIVHLGRKFRSSKKSFTTYTIVLILILTLNQSFITNLFGRIDFTEDKRYTLSHTSKEILKEIDDNIYITIFLDGELPSGFKRLRQSAIDMSRDMYTASNGFIKVNIINPQDGSAQDQQELIAALVDRGLQPTNLSVKNSSGLAQNLIFPYAIVSKGEQEINVNLLQNKIGLSPEQVLNNSIENIEYGLISAIKKLTSDSKTFIGFTEGHGEPSDLELYDAMQTFAQSNQVGRVNLDSIAMEELQKFSVIVIAKPQHKFSESDKYKIDYFVRNGGSVIWAIDQVNADIENLRESTHQVLLGKELNLDDQLFLYGVRLNYDLIADMNCAQIPLSVGNINGQPQIELTPWFFYPILMPNRTHAAVKNLDGIRSEFIGTIDTIATPTIKKEIILESSPFSKTYKTGSRISLQIVEEQPDINTFRSEQKAVAVMLSGHFPYIFENRPTPPGINNAVDLSNISQPAKMFVISDGDWLINQINTKDQSPYPLGWDRFTEQQFANKTLLQNIVDYLANDEKLISLRNREVKLRLLDQAIVKQDKLKWQLINVVFPILLLFILGITQQYLRKRKYTKKVAI
ncbi:gliding motility-associated ABC transporter substrate-binding protein GldG [Sphingobacterium bovistauri]|uniref:Gliding motility-associated ABC transporter substrate-binding protein GldG n=1 Tax=Sphingobacterium bovistauri TaxID=2781959 RepID=A0ABS7ZAZ8_9SPHI|nr:gliding motility-associated ABC transporter substrate-binding protein GldG [Sphingobacterium bovistauri]MCA5006055.1 gliding motility-associated ABC transporter substrate-binding protein GldG [Sphingobacterium bovistauri]